MSLNIVLQLNAQAGSQRCHIPIVSVLDTYSVWAHHNYNNEGRVREVPASLSF